MGPIRLLFVLVLAVVAVVMVYSVIDVAGQLVDQIYLALYGTPFSWDYVPEPFRGFAKTIWDYIVPHWFLIAVILTVAVEFALMFRKTHEGIIIWR